jgi:NADPH-dependent ferric siderophore reductase
MNRLTEKAIALVETPFVRKAKVLAIREWQPDTVREIDVHMPDCDMSKWNSAQHIKCKVGNLTYRDYTPSGWDAETHTCTIIVHVAHEGPGSRWAKGLTKGAAITYLGVESSHHKPASGKKMVFLGDETTIGHFLALQQLADKDAGISGAILLGELHHRDEFDDYFSGWGLQSLHRDGSLHYRELDSWIESQVFIEHSDTVFYLAGYSPAVVRWRKLLRQKGVTGGQLQAQGFWD